MNTILDAIKMYPQQFIDTCYVRSQTTHNKDNAFLQLLMIEFIKYERWVGVEGMLSGKTYLKPLEGVIFCLERYSDIDNETWHEIVKLFEEGKLV